MLNHVIALLIGFVLDLIIGDPYSMPHPIKLIGKLIAVLEKKLNNDEPKKAFRNGGLMVAIVVFVPVLLTAAILLITYRIHFVLGIAAEAILSYYIFAAKSLKVESMKVYKQLEKCDLEASRKAVSMIVGRDTYVLDETGVAKAAIETVAENTSDGVVAPLIYTAIGGPILGFAYKAINTMDSMVGYKNDQFLYFGRIAAKLDDVVNYVPSRISAYLMMFACVFLGKNYDIKGAYKIHKRDSRNHASPNSAQTESTCAGALGIQLAGDAMYFGKWHKKPFIGDPLRPVEYEDIKRANNLMFCSAAICLMIAVVLWLIVDFIIF